MMSKMRDEQSRKSLREFYGITNTSSIQKCPITSNSFNTLVKIYSLLPDRNNNPFARYARCAKAGGLSRISDILCIDGVFSGTGIMINELGTNVGNNEVCNIGKDLSSIERFLMDELDDDLETLKLLDKDVNFDVDCELGSILDMDRSGNDSSIMDSIETKTTNNAGKMSKNDIESEHRRVRLGETYNDMSSGCDDPIVHGEVLKRNALGISLKPSTNCERLRRYTRVQLMNLAYLGKTAFIPEHIMINLGEIGAEIHEKHQVSSAFAIVDCAISKNKKRGAPTESRKEKKKEKKRKKRAELNRKNGVKRLKLQPVVKPKVVQHCRHYLQGRCHEGEKCKFSHDVVPLTKSKPCCHFARQACMKGDDCPFDHHLSKYPCNNYSNTGSCNKGESCLFSHKFSAKEGEEPSAMASKRVISSVDQHDISKANASVGSVTFTSEKTTSKIPKEISVTSTNPPAKRPKGLCFLSFGTSESDDSVKQKTLVQSHNKRQSSPGTKPEMNHYQGRNNSSRMPSMNDSGKNTSGTNDDAVGTPNLDKTLDFSNIFKGIATPSSDRPLNLSEMPKCAPTPPTKGLTDKSKETQPQTSSTKVDLPMRKPPNNSQRALESALAFAAKYVSGIKSSSMSSMKETI